MGKYLDYEPMHIDEIDYSTCRYLYNEVCCNADCDEWLAEYPCVKEICSKDSKNRCKYFVEEEKDERSN